MLRWEASLHHCKIVCVTLGGEVVCVCVYTLLKLSSSYIFPLTTLFPRPFLPILSSFLVLEPGKEKCNWGKSSYYFTSVYFRDILHFEE